MSLADGRRRRKKKSRDIRIWNVLCDNQTGKGGKKPKLRKDDSISPIKVKGMLRGQEKKKKRCITRDLWRRVKKRSRDVQIVASAFPDSLHLADQRVDSIDEINKKREAAQENTPEIRNGCWPDGAQCR